MARDFGDTAPMHTRQTDPHAPLVKVTREITLPWLVSIVAAVISSILVNWITLYITVRENAIRSDNQVERQNDFNKVQNENIKALTVKIETLVTDSSLRKDNDKEQDFKILSHENRITRLEAARK